MRQFAVRISGDISDGALNYALQRRSAGPAEAAPISGLTAALLPGLIGWGRTREMLLLSSTIDAKAALAMGLVDAVVPADELDCGDGAPNYWLQSRSAGGEARGLSRARRRR